MRTWQMEPLPAAMISSLTPNDVEIRFYDDRVEPILYDEPTDGVAISVETYTAKRTYQIASEYRKRGVPVIMGGFHVNLCPDEASQYADAIVLGEAENRWEEVMDDLRHGTLKRKYEKTPRPQLGTVLPDRSIYRGKNYVPIGLVEFGRGCSYHCDFCAIQTVYERTQNQRPVDTVIEDVKAASENNRMIFFVDDNFTVNKERAKEVLRKLAPLKIRWVSQASIQTSYDDELMKLMADSGCQCVLVGFESLNPESLSAMNKNFNAKRGGPAEASHNFRRYNTPVYGTFMFGYDPDTRESFREVQEFAQSNALFIGAFNHVTPFPGTPLYQRIEQEGRLLFKQWWNDENYTYGMIPFRPKQIEPDELKELCFSARKEFYGLRSIWKRGRFKVNRKDFFSLRAYTLINLMHRMDIRQRQGYPLGDDSWQGSMLKVG